MCCSCSRCIKCRCASVCRACWAKSSCKHNRHAYTHHDWMLVCEAQHSYMSSNGPSKTALLLLSVKPTHMVLVNSWFQSKVDVPGTGHQYPIGLTFTSGQECMLPSSCPLATCSKLFACSLMRALRCVASALATRKAACRSMQVYN